MRTLFPTPEKHTPASARGVFMSELPRVCIIGAGSSGITVAKALKDRGIPYDCFEKGDSIGGNWCFRNTNGMSAAYESLHINTDCRLMEYRDYPMPDDTADYPDHRVIMAYFNDYVDHFDLRDSISFKTSVENVQRREDGIWKVALDNDEIRLYDALIVASGHHWDPMLPSPRYPGEFSGKQIHSHRYLRPEEPVDCRGKNVLIVGMGNSAMDIACELSRPGLAEKLFLSARRGVWVVPKYVFGIPTTRMTESPAWIPWQLSRLFISLAVTLNVGKPWNYGLQKPDHKILQAHPTVSQEIYIRLGSGDITPLPGIRSLKGDKVEFTDGREERIDVIVWCTGYKASFPFFNKDFISPSDNDLPLWERMVKPGIDNLFFVGLLQPLGAIMPIAEAQGKLIADHLLGDVAFPEVPAMERDMRKERRIMFRRYADHAPRHTMQVDFSPYLGRLKKIRKKGGKEAARHGRLPPVPARADKQSGKVSDQEQQKVS
jgi:dimethylaniline monooxygenase (N-oxide forming)